MLFQKNQSIFKVELVFISYKRIKHITQWQDLLSQAKFS